MAAAGPPPAARPSAVQVFISHTGPEQHAPSAAFAANLGATLRRAGIDVFIDFDSLQGGDRWQAKLREAAAESFVFVAVLSQPYTRRFWPMHELDVALRHWERLSSAGSACNLILPVRYEDPGSAADVEAFWRGYVPQHEERAELVDPQRWAENVARLSSEFQALRLDPNAANKAREVQLQEDVLARVQDALPAGFVPTSQLVGYEQERQQLLDTLAPDDPATGVWLCGLGGVGKTTLAEHLFAALRPKFPASRAAFIRLPAGEAVDPAPHLARLLEQLGVTPRPGGVMQQHVAQLQQLAAREPLLLVVDNVWSAAAVEALLPPQLAPGSKVVMTSRAPRFERQTPRDYLQQHQLTGLQDEAALQLLRQHAGIAAAEQLSESLQQLECSIVTACAGLPLALVVMGGLMRQEPDEQLVVPRAELWQGALDSLAKGSSGGAVTDDRLREVLSLSFAGLPGAAQSMFLDVVSVLPGQPAKAAEVAWRCQWGAMAALHFRLLQRRGLVSVRDGRLAVHDVVCSLGRDMIESPGSPHYASRVWLKADGCPVEFKGQLQPLEAVSLHGLRPEAWSEPALQGRSLGQLRIVLGSKHCWLQPLLVAKQLLWFEAGSSPLDAHLGLIPNVLFRALDYVPPAVQAAANALLVAAACRILSALRQLGLSRCTELTELPAWFGQLSALQILNLSGCKQLAQLPASFGQLSSLQDLDLTGCKQLAQLPASFGQLSALQWLELTGCDQLAELRPHLGSCQRCSS